MTQQEWIQIITGMLGSFGFSVLFHIQGKKLLLTTLGGALSWTIFLVLKNWIPSENLCYFISAAVITLYAEIFARVEKTPTTTFLVPSIIPAIPGSALYYTMYHALNKQWSQFFQKALLALQIALSLALGIIAVTTLARLLVACLRAARSKTHERQETASKASVQDTVPEQSPVE